MTDLPPATIRSVLRAGGWEAGRVVPVKVPRVLQPILFDAAERVLREFDGLVFGEAAGGIECATCRVEIDPSQCTHLLSELADYEELLGLNLFPLGELDYGHAHLVISEDGFIYLLTDELEPLAS